MDHYKIINKELVEKVQEMKLTVSEYRTELLNLRSKLIDAENSLFHLRRVGSDLTKDSFRNYLKLFDPRSALLVHLENELHADTDGSSPTSSANRGRQSSRLAAELRRSNTFIQNRSVASISPIRLSDNVVDSGGTDADEEDDEFIEYADEMEVVQTHDDSSNIARNATGVIIEEPEDGDEAAHYVVQSNDDPSVPLTSTTQDTASEFTQMSHDFTTEVETELPPSETENDLDSMEDEEEVHSSSSQRTLRDLTNTMNLNDGSTRHKKVRGHPKKSKQKNIGDTKHVTLSRGKLSAKPRVDETIDEPRYLSRLEQRNESSFRLSHHDVTASSFSLTDLTVNQFLAENCSTPNTIRSNNSMESETQTSKTEQHTLRPRRNCAPKSFAERSVNSKLRNETTEPSLGYSRHRHKVRK